MVGDYKVTILCVSTRFKDSLWMHRRPGSRYAIWKKHRQKYYGWTAQIIQHEIDHLEGIII